jgi:nucleoside-diphosphate-sugar epimerase
MTRALVTGAGGFVGSALSRRLIADGLEVHALVGEATPGWRLEGIRQHARVHIGDLCDAERVTEIVRSSRPDWIFHLAAHGAYPSQTDRRRMILTNILGTSHLLEAAASVGFEAFINTGSSSEYGLKDHAPSEDDALEPNSDYAVTKAAATLLCSREGRRLGANIVTLRLYSAYGPWEDPSRLVPALAVYGLAGRLPPLASPGTARDFVYIDDVVDAYLAAAATASPRPGAVYNIGTGIQVTLAEAVAVAKHVLGLDIEPSWGGFSDRIWDTSVWVADSRRAESSLGWRSRRTFEQGFQDFVEWLRAGGGHVARYQLATRKDAV